MRNDFDTIRNQLLAAIYSRNYQSVESLYEKLWKKIEKTKTFSEIDQKALNQTQTLFRKFQNQLIDYCSNDIRKINNRIRSTMANIVRESTKSPQYIGYDAWVKKLGLTGKSFHVMLKTVSLFQLTTGCSNYCRRCNEWALAGPRKHFDFDAIKRLTTELHQTGNRTFSYYSASDPLDWKHGEKNLVDIVAFIMAMRFNTEFGFLTKIPKGSDRVAEKLLKMDANLAISVTPQNRDRMQKIEKTVGKKFEAQHDDDELLIPAGLDEDFNSIKASITDHYGTEMTPEGAFLIVPAFTSALNLTGQCRIPISDASTFFLRKRVGREAWAVEYFKPLKAVALNGKKFVLDRLLDAQIENIMQDNGSGDPSPPGMMNLNEFFKTYEAPAVRQRKNLFRAVVKDLRKRILSNEKYREQSEKNRNLFKMHVRHYLEFCQMPHVARLKKNVFSFYLKAIAHYLKHRPDGRQIILHLRKNDKKKVAAKYQRLFNIHETSVETLIEETNTDTFGLFQMLMFTLLDDPDHEVIHRFIERRPVTYDATSDRFIQDPQNSGGAS